LKFFIFLFLFVSPILAQFSNIVFHDSVTSFVFYNNYKYFPKLDSTIVCNGNDCHWEYDTIGIDSTIASSVSIFYHKIRVSYTFFSNVNDSFKIVPTVKSCLSMQPCNIIPIDSITGDTVINPGTNKIMFIYYKVSISEPPMSIVELKEIRLYKIQIINKCFMKYNSHIDKNNDNLFDLKGRIIKKKITHNNKFVYKASNENTTNKAINH